MAGENFETTRWFAFGIEPSPTQIVQAVMVNVGRSRFVVVYGDAGSHDDGFDSELGTGPGRIGTCVFCVHDSLVA